MAGTLFLPFLNKVCFAQPVLTPQLPRKPPEIAIPKGWVHTSCIESVPRSGYLPFRLVPMPNLTSPVPCSDWLVGSVIKPCKVSPTPALVFTSEWYLHWSIITIPALVSHMSWCFSLTLKCSHVLPSRLHHWVAQGCPHPGTSQHLALSSWKADGPETPGTSPTT